VEKPKKKLKIWAHLLAGGLAGMLGQTVAYPFDTIRHRMQLEGVAKGVPRYRSTMDAMKLILRNEGWRGFYVGLSITYWKTMPANAIAFVVYDRMKWWLEIDGSEA
jgi:solute carrier family 25 protein 16